MNVVVEKQIYLGKIRDPGNFLQAFLSFIFQNRNDICAIS